MHEFERLYRCLPSGSALRIVKSPPDVFAVCAYFAKITGCYCLYGDTPKDIREAIVKAQAAGKEWRRVLDRSKSPNLRSFPVEVLGFLEVLEKNRERATDDLVRDKAFVKACLFLIAASDEACVGVGIPSAGLGGYFELNVEIRLGSGTLCRYVPSDMMRVLPKQHTPRSGFNIRSLTHHLALVAASEVRPVWVQMPFQTRSGPTYNILLAPWPLEIRSSHFRPALRHSSQPGVGYFDYSPSGACGPKNVQSWLQRLLLRASELGQSVDLIVFPEGALNESEWLKVSKVAAKHGASLIAGIGSPPSDNGLGGNCLKVKAPFPWGGDVVQEKHHRWHIDEAQIRSYGLGGTLDHQKTWWENIRVQSRKLHFLAVNSDLVVCPLICEDLARQEPVAELVRSVGPNLVVALLMDGPQLPNRWSARYAAVLADDPGSSVLTVSSLGMVQLSRPNGFCRSRVFASWKDSLGSFISLELATGEEALILNVQFRGLKETSIDGRHDGGVASTPVLCGTHSLTLSER